MVPVYYDDTSSSWIVCSENDSNWYDYHAADVSKAGTAEGDSKQSKWANVMLTDNIVVQKDGISYNATQVKELLTAKNLSTIVGAKVTTEGSMLVWIPRYAYKITYYSEAAKSTIIGYSDSRGFVDTDGKTPSDMQTPTTSINVNGTIGSTNYEYYRPHPAFEKDLDQGGWRTKITGIWVGKFEATGTTTAVTTLSTSNTRALNGQNIGVLYDSLKNNFKAGTTESHMMKNSEWGACVYIAESKYGRNEVPISKNTSSSYYTGEGNYINKQDQSTTGNIYGIYDIVGGTYEYVASYIPNNSVRYGNQFAHTDDSYAIDNNKTESTPYATAYNYKSTNDISYYNYVLNINKVFGDGICETSITNGPSWHSTTTNSNFAYHVSPFFGRGGSYDEDDSCSFKFSAVNGAWSKNSGGTRLICIVR